MKYYFVGNKTDYAVCLKNVVNFCVAKKYEMNFWGYIFTCVHIWKCRPFEG